MGQTDGWMQGGLLIFDKRGNLRYVYEENFGDEIDIELLTAAVAEARKNVEESSSSSFQNDGNGEQ